MADSNKVELCIMNATCYVAIVAEASVEMAAEWWV